MRDLLQLLRTEHEESLHCAPLKVFIYFINTKVCYQILIRRFLHCFKHVKIITVNMNNMMVHFSLNLEAPPEQQTDLSLSAAQVGRREQSQSLW